MPSHRLTEIDALHLHEFPFLQAGDRCFYLGEYTARRGYEFSSTNDLVFNLKKGVSYRGTSAWKYKLKAIQDCATALRSCISLDWLSAATLVPMPPSKAKSHPEYDDRLLQVLLAIGDQVSLDCDIRELIVQTSSYAPSHSNTERTNPADLRRLYQLAEDVLQPKPRLIGLFDDVITTGAHFKAAKDLFQKQWPGIGVFGLFVARVVRSDDEYLTSL